MMKFLFAWRYFKAKKSTNAINVISWISIVAMVIGTASLILVLSVFNGFEGLVKSLYSSFYPPIRISSQTGKTVSLTAAQLARIRSVKGVSHVSLVVEEKALLQNRSAEEDSVDFQSIIYIKGVDTAYSAVSDVAGHMVEGEFKTGDADHPLLVLGAGIQNAVGVRADRNIRPLIIYLPRKGVNDLSDPMRSLSSEAVNTSGSFVIQQDFDNKYAITNLDFVKRMLGMDENTFSAAELSVAANTDPDRARDEIRKLLGKDYLVQNRFEQNASLFSVMQVEKWFIYAILSLILVVAAFNMIGALTMLVLEKKQDISVLHALGANRRFIQGIFVSEGLLLALIGGGVGMLFAFVLGLLQIRFHLIPLQGSTFMIDYFPVKMVATDFILVSLTVLVIALLAAWIPARKAARQQFLMRSE
jgi:lipoprotein-releasing system permease protein